ncbi:hypothetical protein [Fibrivirga algicola]|nr:hypothetical protein [Fibrivirga algicola]
MLFEKVDYWATLAVRNMQVSEPTYLFTIASLHQLSRDLAKSNFVPTDAQKVILERALQLLDLEIGFQISEHPDFSVTLNQWLALRDEK